MRGHVGRDRVAVRDSRDLRVTGLGDAGAVVGDRDLGAGLLQARRERLAERTHRRARQDDVIDFDLHQIAGERRIGRAAGENLLGHRAGRIPGSCTHFSGRFPAR